MRAVHIPMNNDQRLAQQAQTGDTDAFGGLYDAYGRKVYAFVYYRIQHKETAEDLTSTCFLKALEKIRSFDPTKGSFSAWLFRIARNTVIDHFRTMRPTVDIEDIWDALASDVDVARDAEVAERLARVRDALQELSPLQRDVVLMRLWDGLSHAEIAAIIGTSEASCKMAYSRALAALRTRAPLAALLLILANPLS